MIDSEYKYKYDIHTGLIKLTNGYQKIEDGIMVDIVDNGYIPYVDEITRVDYQALDKKADCIVSGVDRLIHTYTTTHLRAAQGSPYNYALRITH